MAFERRLPAPTGDNLADLAAEEYEIEVLTDDYEEEPGESPVPHSANLVDILDPKEVRKLSKDLLELVGQDAASLSDWRRIMKDGLENLGIRPETVEELFQGSATVSHPLLLESIVKYQAKAAAQLLPPGGPAQAKVIGTSTPEKRQAALRVADYLNWLVEEGIEEYKSEHDRMLFYQAFFGSGIIKQYWDSGENRAKVRNVPLYNVIMDYHAPSFSGARRICEVIPTTRREVEEGQDKGLYSTAYNISTASAKNEYTELLREIMKLQGRDDVPYSAGEEVVLFEIHVRENLEGFSSPAPYVITLDCASGECLAIYRDWVEDDYTFKRIETYHHYPLIPGFGIFGLGYTHMIGGLSDSSSKALRQLLDAGTFSNFPAGFKTQSLRVMGSTDPLMPGEWRDVNAVAQDLSKSFMPLPYKEPSPTLVKLLEFMTQEGKRFADSAEEIVQNAKNYGPVNTTLALMEASGQLFSGIHRRLFESQRRELRALFRLEQYFGAPEYPYDVNPYPPSIKQQDFDGQVEALPVTDPRAPSEAHALARSMAHLQVATQVPEKHYMEEVLVDIHRALGEDAPERFVKLTKPPPPMDPVTENAALLTMQPVKAYPPQDHNSHLLVHLHGILNNPLYGQNKVIRAAAEAHLQEHFALKFKGEIERMLGTPIQPGDPNDPKTMEMQNMVAQQAASVVQQVVAMNAQEALALVRQGIELDPALALQAREVAVKEGTLAQRHLESMLKHERETLEDNRDAAMDLLELDQEKDMHEDEMEVKRAALAKKGTTS